MNTTRDDVRSPSIIPATLALFTSVSTLICCALPALLVSVGMGAVMAGLIDAVPGITWMGANKPIVFAVAALVLTISGALQWRARNLPCPIDPVKARACMRLRKISWILWWAAVSAFVIGGFFAFYAADLLL